LLPVSSVPAGLGKIQQNSQETIDYRTYRARAGTLFIPGILSSKQEQKVVRFPSLSKEERWLLSSYFPVDANAISLKT
jgi:hypothetical protein